MINSALELQLEVILSEWPAWCEQRPNVVRPLSGGLTNKTYLLQSADQQLVLRINAANSIALDLNRQAEIEVLQAVADTGIAAKLIYSDPEYRYIVTEFIVAEPWSLHYSNSDVGVDKLAALLRTIHCVGSVSTVLDTELKARRYWQFIDHGSAVAKRLLALSTQLENSMQVANSLNKIPCLCHNDLLAANLLLGADGHVYAIDWEYAATGDAYFDLAAVIEGHELTAKKIEQLMLSYHLDNLEVINMRRLRVARINFCYLDLLWYCAQSELQTELQKGALLHRKLKKIEFLLAGTS